MKSSIPSRGFTLIELLASMAILLLMMAMLFAAFNQASKAWMQGENRVETFQQARAALDMIARDLSQAVVNSNLQFLATGDSLAFVSSVSDNEADGVDLMEVVYRLSYPLSAGTEPPGFTGIFTDSSPPRKLVRRVAPYKMAGADCWDYGFGAPCSNPSDSWDFYDYTHWPETADKRKTSVVAENLVFLNFDFFDISNNKYNYWNTTKNPSGNPWRNEIGGSPGGVGYFPGDSAYMTNRAPAGAFIKIGVLDSRAAKRLKLAVANGGTGTAAYSSITNEATQYFTTYISIPNRTP